MAKHVVTHNRKLHSDCLLDVNPTIAQAEQLDPDFSATLGVAVSATLGVQRQ